VSLRSRPGARQSALSALPPILRGLPGLALDARVLSEPALLFGEGGRVVDPRVGLGLYGPYDVTDSGRRRAIRLGIIGTGPCIELLHQWIERCRGRVAPIRRTRLRGDLKQIPMDPTSYPFFPGLDAAFQVEVVVDQALIETLPTRLPAELRQISYFEPRVTRLVDDVLERLRVLSEKQTSPDVVVIALPTEIRDLVAVASRHRRRAAAPATQAEAALEAIGRDTESGQANLFGTTETYNVTSEDLAKAAAEEEEHGIFHHGLKARAMDIGIPTQLIWEGTLEGINVQDDASRAWNFWTGIYYKAGNTPWRAEQIERGTCFVGIGFYIDRRDSSYRSCMAQAFSDQGEGIVMRGQPFKWEELGSPHLTSALAEDVMRRVLLEYERHMRHRPSRVVVHKWSRYWPGEREGFDRALGDIPATDYVAFGDRGIRFFRAGDNPPVRGTMITLGRGNALLYTRGYVPFLHAHLGPRVPRPLEILEHFGGAPLTQICQEILMLTKLDLNTSDFAGKEPITTGFSYDVGHILAEVRSDATPKTLYRFYM
jgi:hypothetical protein